MCEAFWIKYTKPRLDCKTRWNSTFDMLFSIYSMKIPMTSLLCSCHEIKKFQLSDKEWDLLEWIMNFLKSFKYVSKILSADYSVSLPSVVVTFNILIHEVETILFKLDSKVNRYSDDEQELIAIQAEKEKLLKHYKKCNWIYCVASILYPRHKIDGFEETN